MVCEGDCSRQFHPECLGLSAPPDGRFTCLECKNSEYLSPAHHFYSLSFPILESPGFSFPSSFRQPSVFQL